MKKAILLSIIGAALFLLVVYLGLFELMWGSAFEKTEVKDIASFTSDDGAYTLYFQQLGDPLFFGPVDARFVLKDETGKKVNAVDTSISNDGGSACRENVGSVEWGEEAVTVTIHPGEGQGDKIVIKYKS